MSFKGKLSLLFGISVLIAIGLVTFISGIGSDGQSLFSWVIYVFKYLVGACFIFAIFVDRRLYISFFAMRSTKNSLSMGVISILVICLLVSVAWLSTVLEKSIDLTEEGINSLAPQSMKLLDNLKEDMTVRVFYKGKTGNQQKRIIKNSLGFYKQSSSYIKDHYHDAYIDIQLADEYLRNLPGNNNETIFVFVEYKGKKSPVDIPFNEEKITSAMINVTRLETKNIYILSGHSERDPENSQGEGLSALKESLLKSSFETKEWNFIERGEGLPSDAAALVIAGPDQDFLEKEIQWLDDYLETGGRLLVALDPDKKHNLSEWLKKYGLGYRGHYVLDQVSRVMGMGRASPLGVQFDPQHKITGSFPRGTFALFHIASDLQVDGTPADLSVTELVKTNDLGAVSVPSLDQLKSNAQGAGAQIMALLVESSPGDEKQEGESSDNENSSEEKKQNMILALFGDSDFMSNSFLSAGMNRDLVMNTISYLVSESDLISIRPKRLKATQLVLTDINSSIIVIFSMVLPIVSVILAFILWFRRRSS